ncbi:MAG: hypothetical protein GYB64_16395 [Chloroflexi bacterium]|nr:hypothetical protein [Chloroflexota bacterium]
MTQNHSDQTEEAAANRLAELSIKRDRTLADLDALHAAERATRRAIEAFAPRLEEELDGFSDRLTGAGEGRDRVLNEWQAALTDQTAAFRDLLQEWDRVKTQENILVQMLIELERQIDQVSRQLE